MLVHPQFDPIAIHIGSGGVHWYGRNNWSMANNPDETNFRRWRENFDRAAPSFLEMNGGSGCSKDRFAGIAPADVAPTRF